MSSFRHIRKKTFSLRLCVKLIFQKSFIKFIRLFAMKIISLIPARMNSTRFPGKPLARIHGRPMIEHIFRRAALCSELDAVYVATGDGEIRDAVEKFGGKVIMTSPDHERATDRVAEAVKSLPADIVVMIQGDEPMITPEMITLAVNPMRRNSAIECVNLVRRIENREDFINRNTIKVVMDIRQDAVYFSRSPIPAIDFSQNNHLPVFKQVCVIPFRRDFLCHFTSLPPTPLEQAESIDMLRIIEHGGRIRLVETENDTHAVDTPDDLRLVEKLMKNDSLISVYEKTAVDGAKL